MSPLLFLALLPSQDLATRIVEVATGGEHRCVRTLDGRVKCWGGNRSGELGAGLTARAVPAREARFVSLGTGKQAIQVVTGANHTCALLNDRSVKCWGKNDGELGKPKAQARESLGTLPEDMGDKLLPVPLPNGVKPLRLSASLVGTCALAEGGDVWCWTHMGSEPGIIEKIEYTKQAKQAVLANYSGCALTVDGEVICWSTYTEDGFAGTEDPRGQYPGGKMSDKVVLDANDRVKQLSARGMHACALMDDNRVKCWGKNESGQLGVGDRSVRGNAPGTMGRNLPEVDLGARGQILDIDCGRYHCCARLDTGTAKCWGSNSNGELGVPIASDVGGAEDDLGENAPFMQLPPLSSVGQLSAGEEATCVVLTGGEVYCTGSSETKGKFIEKIEF